MSEHNLAEPLPQIIKISAHSAIAGYHWPERGTAPPGYINGMAIVFARAYCKFRDGDPYALAIAVANTRNNSTDALSHYSGQFRQLGMENEISGAATLRHLFVLLLGLGMRESSGRWCEGRDMAADNTGSDTAEAGLFQTSWNAHSASPLLPRLFSQYRAKQVCFLDVFKDGVTATPEDLQNYGSGDGHEFQRLSKECPAFAAEFAAIGLRTIRTHWGPINRRAAQLRPEADRMFHDIQEAVDSLNLCSNVW